MNFLIFDENLILTLWRTLVLVIPYHQQLSQARHLGDFCDDPEKALNAIVGEHHRCEPRCPWWDKRQEQRTVHTGPLLHETGNKEKHRLFRLQTSFFIIVSVIIFHFHGKLL